MSALARAGGAAHVYVSDLDTPAPDLEPDDAHHLVRVLRIQRGERVTVGDGAGRWRLCTATGEEKGPLEASGPVELDARPQPLITVGFALVKGERPEWIVQKLTEVGVDRIVPLRSRRCVVRWTQEQESKNLVRLRRVAREAAMQSRRAWLPEVADVAGLDAAATAPRALADPSGEPPSLAMPTVFVGPEGGWEPEELNGAATVALGPQVLRAETAAVAAGVLLCALRAALVGPPA